MKAVNLIPLERRQTQTTSQLARFSGSAVAAAAVPIVVAAVVLGFVAHSASSSAAEKRQQLREVQTQLALVPPAKQKVSPSALASASSRRAAVVSLAQRRVGWDAFLGSLSRVLPEDVWLVGLSANPSGTAVSAPAAAATSSSGSSTATTPTAPFTISGYTYSQRSVARVLDRLVLIPWLSDVQLTGTSLTPLGTRNVVQFSVGASIATSGGAS